MTSRRGFLAGLLAASLMPRPSWADVGNPKYLSAAQLAGGSYALFGLNENSAVVFSVPLPDRGHAAAAHPNMPIAVAFARRPGRFALVIDCTSGNVIATLDAPADRHFYGHGAYSVDGSTLFTSENAFELGQGRIGVWDTTGGYRRLGEFSSGGVGPHDIALHPSGDILVVANGGIETHPDSGRAKLNIPTMRPNLSYLSLSGEVIEKVELPPECAMNSIRHLNVRTDGEVAFAMQWQGTTEAPPLLGLHQKGGNLRLLSAPDLAHHRMKGYAGSVAFSADGKLVAITSPRGNQIQIFDCLTGSFVATHASPDVSGIAPRQDSFLTTSGNGDVTAVSVDEQKLPMMYEHKWDNHLICTANIAGL